jgi:hypothetical protein
MLLSFLKPGTTVFRRVLTMVFNTEDYWVFWTFPSSGILETRKHDVPPFYLRTETEPVSETSCFLVSRIPDDGKVQKKPVIL